VAFVGKGRGGATFETHTCTEGRRPGVGTVIGGTRTTGGGTPRRAAAVVDTAEIQLTHIAANAFLSSLQRRRGRAVIVLGFAWLATTTRSTSGCLGCVWQWLIHLPEAQLELGPKEPPSSE
jgi:hypothetical protein